MQGVMCVPERTWPLRDWSRVYGVIQRCWSMQHFLQFPFRIPRRSPSMCMPPIFFARWMANLLLVDAKENLQGGLKWELALLQHSPGILQALSPDLTLRVFSSGSRESRTGFVMGERRHWLREDRLISYIATVVSIRKDEGMMEC